MRGSGIGPMAGQGAQIALGGQEFGVARHLGGAIGLRRRPASRASSAVDLLLAFLGFERAGAIDQRAARLGQRRGAVDAAGACRAMSLARSASLLEPGDVGMAADRAGRGARRVDQHGVERLERPVPILPRSPHFSASRTRRHPGPAQHLLIAPARWKKRKVSRTRSTTLLARHAGLRRGPIAPAEWRAIPNS